MEDDRAYRSPREPSPTRSYRDEGRMEDYPQEPSRPSRYEERIPYQRPYRERDYYDYNQDRQEDYYHEERTSREGRRGNLGADRARTYGYRGRET